VAVHRRAFALIIVLIATAAVFALAMQGAVAMRTATVEAGAIKRNAELRRQATTAAVRTLIALTRTDVQTTGGGASGPDESPAASPAGSVNQQELPDMPVEMREFLEGLLQEGEEDGGGAAAGSGSRSGASRGGARGALARIGLPVAPVEVQVNGTAFVVSLSDAAGGVNLNKADEAQLSRFFLAAGVQEPRHVSLAHELLDWRDEDNVPRSRGAEQTAHFRRGVTIRNGPLRAVEELLYLPSMTPDLFERIRDDATVIGEGRLHAGSASRAALMSLPSMTAEAVDRILFLRRSGTLDDETLEGAISVRSRQAAPMLRTTPSSFVRVRVAPKRGGPAFSGITVVDASRGPRNLTLRLDGSGVKEGAASR